MITDVISEVHLIYLRLCGLYPSAWRFGEKGRGHANSTWALVWSCFVAIAISTFPVVNLVDYTMYFLNDIKSMEFYRLLTFDFQLDLTAQTLAVFAILIWKGRQISQLLLDLSTVLKETIAAQRLRRVRYWSCTIAFVWILFWMTVHIAGYFMFKIRRDIQNWASFTRPSHFLTVSGPLVPVYIDDLVGGVSHLVRTHTELLALTFVTSVVVLLAVGFQQVLGELENALHLQTEDRVNVLTKAARLYLKLRTLTNKFNRCFALLFLLFFFRDTWSCMVVFAVSFRIPEPQRHEESWELYQRRLKFDDDLANHDIIVGCIGLANAMLKYVVCIYCHATVRNIVESLEEMEESVTSGDIHVQVKEMLNTIQPNSGAISAGGVHITIESTTAVLGVLLSYVVIIYQTRDAAVGDQQYAKKSDFPYLAELLSGLLLNSSTIRNHSCHDQSCRA